MKKKVIHVLELLEEFSASFFFIAGTIVSLIGVFTRYVLNSPVTWTTEIFEMFMVFAIFIGFGMALKGNHHITVDLVYEKMPPVIKKVFNLVSNIIGAGFSLFLFLKGIEVVTVAQQQGGVTVDVGIPLWLTYIAMPLGMGLLFIHFLVKIYQVIRDWNKTQEEVQMDVEDLF